MSGHWLGRLLGLRGRGASPEDADALVREAIASREAGRPAEAERSLYRALALEPGSAEIQLQLADLYRALGRHDAALDRCREAVRLAPGAAPAYNNLGNAYRSVGQLDSAIQAYRRAIELDDALAEAHFNLGIALHHTGDQEGAARHFRAARRAQPAFAEASLNLGYVLEEQGDPAGAIQAYRDAIALAPEMAEAHVNLGMQLLLCGQYGEGWEEYDWRLRYPEYSGADLASRARRWRGEPLGGGTLLLDAEQGFGDAIQFLRYAALAAERGARVVVRCAPELAALAARTPGVAAAFARGSPLPVFDAYCPLPSLPRIFATTLATIPARVPYVLPDPGAVDRWAARLGAATGGRRVGLVWASQSGHRTAAAKSLGLDILAPLAAVPGLTFYSLQKGDAARQALRPPAGMHLVDLGPDLRDFSDTAAVLAGLDLVISVDTAVAHLAGAMAKPTFTLLKFAPDWRWLLGRDDSPWYPGMRLYRQESTGDWGRPVAALVGDLRRLGPSPPARRQA
jgi:tetratricopeptide (TPR) repeat protein